MLNHFEDCSSYWIIDFGVYKYCLKQLVELVESKRRMLTNLMSNVEYKYKLTYSKSRLKKCFEDVQGT